MVGGIGKDQAEEGGVSSSRIIRQAIQASVRQYNQPPELAEILFKWVSEILSGNESISDTDVTHRRAEEAFEKVVLNSENPDGEDTE